MIAAVAIEESMLSYVRTKMSSPALPLRFSQLSQPRQALVRLCQTINYGYIQALDVRDSEPVLDPSPLAFMNVNLGSDPWIPRSSHRSHA
jgi:hypothetical protein